MINEYDFSYNKTRVHTILDNAVGLTEYGYDDLGRISEEKDSDGNILKSYTYLDGTLVFYHPDNLPTTQ